MRLPNTSPLQKPAAATPPAPVLPRARRSLRAAGICAALLLVLGQPNGRAEQRAWFGPASETLSADGTTLYVAGERSGEIAVVDLAANRETRRFAVRGMPTGLAADGQRLVVTTMGSRDEVVSLDAGTGRTLQSRSAGPGERSPVLDGRRGLLYTCQEHAGTVSFLRWPAGRKATSVVAGREPFGASLSADGKTLAVANLLPSGAASERVVRAEVALLHAATGNVRRRVELPNGSTSVRGLAFHPVRPICAVVHNVARFQVPATQVEFGWMNVAAISLVDAACDTLLASIILDEARRGAANPWAVAWSPDGRFLCVVHAGTHELSVIDAPALETKLASKAEGAFVSDFTFLRGIRTRVPLAGKGPRAVVVHGHTAYATEFFSDSLSAVDLDAARVLWQIPLGRQESADPQREGERLFNDATICHQGWQSCASCHPDGRADGLNWDLLNDGIGNPKNTKSLLLAHATPPAMSLGVRASAEEAVRSGIRHILFAKVEEKQAAALDEYLRSMRPVPSPHLVKGRLSAAAAKGRRLFESSEVACAVCHPAPLFTDLQRHVLADPNASDRSGLPLDTPTLVECWRTAPYLHDGSAITIQEVLTTRNPRDSHGRTSHLSQRQIADLAAYVLSL